MKASVRTVRDDAQTASGACVIPFSIDRFSGKSLADQIADGIRGAVASGVYRSGDVLPTRKQFARALKVSERAPREAVAVTPANAAATTAAPQTRQTIFHPTGPVDLNDGKSGYEMKGRTTKLDDGTWREQYEIRIPWHAVNKADPKTGDCLSFGLCLNDFDNEGYGTYTCLGAYHLFFTEQFGALILGE